MTKSTEEKEIGLFSVLIVAVLFLASGLLLGFIYMASFPANAFKDISELQGYEISLKERGLDFSSEPGTAYYFVGNESRRRSWEGKRANLISPNTDEIYISSGEINDWIKANFEPAKVDPTQPQSGVSIVPGMLNFSLNGELGFYLSVPMEFKGYGMSFKRTLFLNGDLNSGAGTGIVLKQVGLGSAKIPVEANIAQTLVDVLFNAYLTSEEVGVLRSAWNDNVASAEIQQNTLRLKMR